VKISHVRFFSGKAPREKISREIFLRGLGLGQQTKNILLFRGVVEGFLVPLHFNFKIES